MKISASVVTFNNEKEIRGVLDSLLNSTCIEELEIVVVDNCSSDKTKNIIKEEYPRIKLIESSINCGYGAGHNQALRMVNSDYHFVINPDILFESNLIENIVNYLDNNKDVVLCIPRVHDLNGDLKYPPKRDPKIRYLVARYLSKTIIDELLINSYTMKRKVDKAKEPFEISVCSGSFMAMRRSAVETVGYFDERYFMYFEDFDLSRSIRKIGRIMYLPQFQVLHEGKRAAHHSKAARNMLLNSMIKYYIKWGL